MPYNLPDVMFSYVTLMHFISNNKHFLVIPEINGLQKMVEFGEKVIINLQKGSSNDELSQSVDELYHGMEEFSEVIPNLTFLPGIRDGILDNYMDLFMDIDYIRENLGNDNVGLKNKVIQLPVSEMGLKSKSFVLTGAKKQLPYTRLTLAYQFSEDAASNLSNNHSLVPHDEIVNEIKNNNK